MKKDWCGFANPGTYGHECGAPAEFVGIQNSDLTKNGIFYTRRCAKCKAIKGGENSGVYKWEVFNASAHVNLWK